MAIEIRIRESVPNGKGVSPFITGRLMLKVSPLNFICQSSRHQNLSNHLIHQISSQDSISGEPAKSKTLCTIKLNNLGLSLLRTRRNGWAISDLTFRPPVPGPGTKYSPKATGKETSTVSSPMALGGLGICYAMDCC
jgi:hypothetical protein